MVIDFYGENWFTFLAAVGHLLSIPNMSSAFIKLVTCMEAYKNMCYR